MKLGCQSSLVSYADAAAPDQDKVLLRLKEAHRLGLVNVSDPLQRWQDPGYLRWIAEQAAQLGITLDSGWSDCWASPDPTQLKPLQEFSSKLEAVTSHLGSRVFSLVVTDCDRFFKNPPLDEQLALIAERLQPLADLAAKAGVSLALENHADYRGSELVRIFKQVGRRSLGCRLDTGNPFIMGEDPVDAAQVLAPYTYDVHLKDMWVGLGRHWHLQQKYPVPSQVGAPLGQGDVDLPAIMEILANKAPSPADLCLNIEIDWLPKEIDLRVAAEDSIRYCREKFGRYLTTKE